MIKRYRAHGAPWPYVQYATYVRWYWAKATHRYTRQTQYTVVDNVKQRALIATRDTPVLSLYVAHQHWNSYCDLGWSFIRSLVICAWKHLNLPLNCSLRYTYKAGRIHWERIICEAFNRVSYLYERLVISGRNVCGLWIVLPNAGYWRQWAAAGIVTYRDNNSILRYVLTQHESAYMPTYCAFWRSSPKLASTFNSMSPQDIMPATD